jgi:hypothetical protein
MKYKDEIRTETKCVFNFRERFRILITGITIVNVKTKTENLPGNCISRSSVYVPKILHPPQEAGKVVEINERKTNNIQH